IIGKNSTRLLQGLSPTLEPVNRQHPPVRYAGRDDHHDAFGNGLLHRLIEWYVNVAPAKRLYNYPLGTCGNGCTEQGRVGAGVKGNNVHTRQRIARHRNVLASHGAPCEHDSVMVDDTEEPEIARLEGLNVGRVGLGRLARRIDLAIE